MKFAVAFLGFFLFSTALTALGDPEVNAFPPQLDSYGDEHLSGIWEIVVHRAYVNPFNVVATLIFFLAVCHTFLADRFMNLANHHRRASQKSRKAGTLKKNQIPLISGVFRFLGEVEVIFGLWGIPLILVVLFFFDWSTMVNYLGHQVNFTEPLFVVVIMTLAATRPILKLTELMMWKVANLFGGMLTAWWLTILTLGPLLGSFITGPAAMTICALLLSEKFFDLEPPPGIKYATLGLLFVNISVGGTLTNFAAPPVLMVADSWGWDVAHLFTNFGWKAVLGICISNGIYYFWFRKDFAGLQEKYAVVRLTREWQAEHINQEELSGNIKNLMYEANGERNFVTAFDKKCAGLKAHMKTSLLHQFSAKNLLSDDVAHAFEIRFEQIKLNEMQKRISGFLPISKRVPFKDPNWDHREDFVPMWIMVVHLLFMVWTVFNAHHPVLFVAGLLFFLGFAQVTYPYQNRVDLKPALMVGFFLAGLVVHGGLQAWWIEPVLGALGERSLMGAAMVLTAFNDNAAITYLSTLVPDFSAELKYAVVAGAVTGGGLTVIANAPNPAGQSLLKKFFENNISPLKLLRAALLPTAIMALCFMVL